MSDDLHDQLKRLIVRALMLEEIRPEEIDSDAPLFGEGLGLDSVDALELAIEIERELGVTLPEGAEARPIFRSVSTLADWVRAQRA